MSLANEQISAFLQEQIDAGDFPSAVYLVAEKGEIVFQHALGYAVVEPEKIPARLDTIYDLASLTKPLVTGLSFAISRESGSLDAEFPVYFRDIGQTYREKWNITFENLLTHTSGMPAWDPLYIHGKRPRRRLAEIPFETTIGERVIYSDVNFMLLGIALDKRRNGLAETGEALIFRPLGMKDTMFNPPESLRGRIAANEMGNGYERQMCIELGYLNDAGEQKNPLADAGGSSFRTDVIWGEVHDGNAYFMGGVAGHAGLFSTAEEVFEIALQFLPNYTQLLKPETCKLFSTNFTPGMNENRSYAFQLASTKDSSAGSRMSPESFGHTGFTGTSLWIDPVKDRIFVLLTNRTHNHSLPFVNLNSVRRRFHDLSIDLLER